MTPSPALDSPATRRRRPTRFRAPDRASFGALARARRRSRVPVTLRFVPDETRTPPRVGFAIGRGVGGAVARNRARRRLRAAIAARAERLPPGDYLFGGSAELVTCPFAVIEDRVAGLIDDLPAPT